jgi:4-diphosphocytidyl-2-C-methyl-D-erythritol kinase
VLRWAKCRDLALAVGLGADVPFCVHGGRARVTGVGEILEPLPVEDRRFVVLMPPVSVDTGEVYTQWDERRVASAGARRDDGSVGNDLEAAALDVAPILARWRDRLAEVTGHRPRLAGSGSSWFVEGDSDALGIAGQEFLEIDGARAPLVAVRTLPGTPFPE